MTIRELEEFLSKIEDKDTPVYINAPSNWGCPVPLTGEYMLSEGIFVLFINLDGL